MLKYGQKMQLMDGRKNYVLFENDVMWNYNDLISI